MSRVTLPTLSASPAADQRAVDVGGFRDYLTSRLAGEVRFDRVSRALYSTDASVYQIVPLGVVVPKTEADVFATLEACTKFGVPITARGGGTSQAGQAIGGGVVLDFSKHLHRILEINPRERWARVEPGCVLDDLNLSLKPHGLQFAPDISTSNRATIGGMVANNSSGTHSIIHGKTVDHVLGLRVLLSDGSVIDAGPLEEAEVRARCGPENLEAACYRALRRLAEEHADEIDRRYPKLLRRVGGYNLDAFVARGRENVSAACGSASANAKPQAASARPFNLAHILVGSEGTLAITLEAKLRLIELPKAKIVAVLHFDDLLDALGATPAILTHQPSAVEVLDRYILDSTKLNPEASRLRDELHGEPGAILLVEFYGDRAADLPARLDDLEADLPRRGVRCHLRRAVEPAAQVRIWKLRKLALGLSMAEKGDAKSLSFVEDTAVAPENLRDYIAEFLEVVKRHGTRAGVYAHASVGCLHVRPVVDLKTEAGVRQLEVIAADIADLVLKYGGALSGEHGDGLVRSPFQEKMFGPALYQAFRELKQTFDPRGILNPGKIVDAPALATNLRFGAAYVTPDVPTTFDFSTDGGVVRAAELCAGVGECRKRSDGTMCPSFQATREEQHSTRGRANMLRLAMTGQLGLGGLSDPELHPVLDLCLECKACKSECPTNVDMARLKAEFLDQYHKRHGLPWRSWFFGRVAAFSRLGSALAPVSNWLVRNRFGRWLNEKLLGIDRRRLPPRFARLDLTVRWILDERGSTPAAGAAAEVLLFPDTFTLYYEPHIGVAAKKVLAALGCVPRLGLPAGSSPKLSWPWPSQLRCCGRPLISNGMLDEAVDCARHNVEQLYPWAAAGKAITACEPSCILTIKDDYPALLRGEPRRRAQVVAAACQTFEECVVRASDARTPPDMNRALKPVEPAACRDRVLVQPHCHQRALVGVAPLLQALRRFSLAEVIDLDAGCCGMAGSFGYEREHYEVSRLVGEQRLFPAVRAADGQTRIAASGFSCRLQIQHFTGRVALHPAELLADHLEPAPYA